jgi:hypothetical protein
MMVGLRPLGDLEPPEAAALLVGALVGLRSLRDLDPPYKI